MQDSCSAQISAQLQVFIRYYFGYYNVNFSIAVSIILSFFPNEEDWRVGNWQVDTNTLIAIIKAQMYLKSMILYLGKISEGKAMGL